MVTYCRIKKYSHHFVVYQMREMAQKLTMSFVRPLVEQKLTYKRGRYVPEPAKVYAAATRDRREVRLHINLWDSYLKHMEFQGIPPKFMSIEEVPMYEPVECEFSVVEHMQPREDQPRVIQYMLEDGKTKLVTLHTGGGKTFCAAKAIEAISQRVLIQIAAKYVDKWISDVKELLQLSKKDIVVLKGAKAINNVVNLAIAGELHAKVIIVSNTTMQRWFKDYEQGKNSMAIEPYDFCQTLGIGLKLIDEAHEHQHLIFKQDLYNHVPKLLCLTATIRTDSQFRNKMLEIQFPTCERFVPKDRVPHVRAKAIFYRMERPELVRHINPQKMYSHTLFEESLMKRAKYLGHYFAMIDAVLYNMYASKREDGQKAIVFCATTAMCTKLTEYLEMRYPALDVGRYNAEDEYEVLMESDISVSTILSAGTAVDIPGLRTVLMTTNIASSQANIQVAGRLRPLKDWPDIDPDFVYFICKDIPKHVEYHGKKKKLMTPLVKSLFEAESAFVIGRKKD